MEKRTTFLNIPRHPGRVPGSTVPVSEKLEPLVRSFAARWTPEQVRGDGVCSDVFRNPIGDRPA
jgi:hypothetical protein